MTEHEKAARELYDCLEDARDKGAWIESRLTIIAATIKEAVEAERAWLNVVWVQLLHEHPSASPEWISAAVNRARTNR